MTDRARFNDFSNVTYEEALQRAQDLIPLLREHAPTADRLTRMAPAVEAADRKSTRLNSSH